MDGMKGNAATILRWGLAFVFFYAAISALRHPDLWAAYFPQSILQAASSNVILVGFSIYELLLAAWLFIGKKTRWASLFAVITFAAIVLFNLPSMDAVFGDVGLAMAALALYETSREHDFKEEEAE